MTNILLPTGTQVTGQFCGLFSLSLRTYYNFSLIFTFKTKNTKQLLLNWLTLNELPLTTNTVPVFDIFA